MALKEAVKYVNQVMQELDDPTLEGETATIDFLTTALLKNGDLSQEEIVELFVCLVSVIEALNDFIDEYV